MLWIQEIINLSYVFYNILTVLEWKHSAYLHTFFFYQSGLCDIKSVFHFKLKTKLWKSALL